jgi:hypothetical protein
LACSEGKYYCGKTNNVEKRFGEHVRGIGSAWTRKYPPLPLPSGLLFKKLLTSLLDEDYEVEKLMEKYGIDNVRGGSYVTIKLALTDRNCLEKKLRHAREECFSCGKTGHYVNACPDKPPENKAKRAHKICERCNRDSHTITACYALTKLDGSPLPHY